MSMWNTINERVSERPIQRLASWLTPNLIAFIASFCIMTLELVAGRIISQHVGASLYTWTAVIGVVLGGITIGNFIGGWLADLYVPRRSLSIIFLLAAAGSITAPFLNNWMGGWDWYQSDVGFFEGGWLLLIGPWDSLSDISWSMRIFIHVTFVFLVPSALLGLIGPIVAKMALDQGRAPGRTIGNVYAFGALGSIVGTFVTGFFLIAYLGTIGVILGVAMVLGFIGCLLGVRAWWPTVTTLLIATALLASGSQRVAGQSMFFADLLDADAEGIVYVDESQYSYIQVRENQNTGIRTLTLDNLVHSYLDLSDFTNLLYGYENTYKAIMMNMYKDAIYSTAAEPDLVSTLFIGGGGFVFPRFVYSSFPRTHIQVAELDPAVTRAGFEALGLDEDYVRVVDSIDEITVEEDIIWIRNIDARNHIEDLARRKRAGKDIVFDFVFGDAFNDFSVPYHLTTLEFNNKIAEILNPETGIYMVNVIDIFDSGKFLGAVLNTFERTFSHVYIFSSSVGGPNRNTSGRDTFVVVGSMQELDLDWLPGTDEPFVFDGSLLSDTDLKDLRSKSKGMILTDNHAPVEQLLAPVVKKR